MQFFSTEKLIMLNMSIDHWIQQTSSVKNIPICFMEVLR